MSKKKGNSWIDALKEYNKGHDGAWCVPRKNTPEYKALTNIHKYEIKKTPLSERDKELYNKERDNIKIKQIQKYIDPDNKMPKNKYYKYQNINEDTKIRLNRIALWSSSDVFGALKK